MERKTGEAGDFKMSLSSPDQKVKNAKEFEPTPSKRDRLIRIAAILALLFLLLFFIFKPSVRKRMRFSVDGSSRDFAWVEGNFFTLKGSSLTGLRSKVTFQKQVDPQAQIYGFQGRLLLLTPGQIEVLNPRKGETLAQMDLDFDRIQLLPKELVLYGPDRIVFLNSSLQVEKVQPCQGKADLAVMSPDGQGLAWLESEKLSEGESTDSINRPSVKNSSADEPSVQNPSAVRKEEGQLVLDPAMNQRGQWEEHDFSCLYAINPKLNQPFRVGSTHHHFYKLVMPSPSFVAALSENGLWMLDLDATPRLRSLPYFAGLDLAADEQFIYLLRAQGLDVFKHSGEEESSLELDINDGYFVSDDDTLYILGSSEEKKPDPEETSLAPEENRSASAETRSNRKDSPQPALSQAEREASQEGKKNWKIQTQTSRLDLVEKPSLKVDRIFRKNAEGKWEEGKLAPSYALITAGDSYALVMDDGIHPLASFFAKD